jgi:DNA polymerase
MKTDKFDRTKESLSFMGINSFTNQWERMYTWGGKLTENIVQALSRDFLTDAMLRLEKAGYTIVFHVHDEIVVELRETSTKTFSTFIKLMSTVPDWAKDCPTNVKGWEGIRYRKD